jgi:hypothetical protein
MKQFIEDASAIRRVEGQSRTDIPDDEAEKKQEAGKGGKLEEYRQKAQEFLDSHRRFFMTFAKDVSLSFKISNRFYIDLEKGEVNLDAKWFSDKDFSREQMLWGCLHELEHFRDLDADAEGVMKNFEYIISLAKKTGEKMLKKWEEKYGANDPELIERLKKQKPIDPKKPDGKTMSAIERSAYKIHHTFYNIFDDINDNSNVARKAPAYEEKAKGGQEISRLYQEKLFAKTDYSALPRHLQFAYKLIREEMVKGEEIALSEEVAEIMIRKVKFQGKEYTPVEIVKNFIKPRKNRDTLARQRHFVLQKTLEPIFEELLAKDLADWDPKKPEKQDGQPQEGEGDGESGNPFDEDYKDYDKNNPDQISEEDIRNWIDKNEKDKKNEEEKKTKEQADENKSTKEKADEAQADMDRSWCEKNGVSPEVFRNFKRIEAEVEPYLQELSKLWHKIIFGSSREIQRIAEGYFKTGTEMDIQEVIEQWPKIQQKKFEDARVMKRIVSRERLLQMPERINVRLVGDMSGSMDAKKRHILQQCVVLILSSLREFNTRLNLIRSQTKSKLEADTEAWIFGNKAERIKKLRSESGPGDEQAAIVRIFEKLNSTIGSTYDNEALEEIQKSFSTDDLRKILRKKTMEIVFEVTDGGSSDPDATKKAIKQLVDSEVIVRAFQIGEVSDDDRQTFKEVWNDGREEKLGEVIGAEIANLIPAITDALKKYLSGVRL